MKSNAEHKASRERESRNKRPSREKSNILRSYGHNEYHNISKIVQNNNQRSGSKKRITELGETQEGTRIMISAKIVSKN